MPLLPRFGIGPLEPAGHGVLFRSVEVFKLEDLGRIVGGESRDGFLKDLMEGSGTGVDHGEGNRGESLRAVGGDQLVRVLEDILSDPTVHEVDIVDGPLEGDGNISVATTHSEHEGLLVGSLRVVGPGE